MQLKQIVLLAWFLVWDVGCQIHQPSDLKIKSSTEPQLDPHSYSNPNETKVRHLTLDLDVQFPQRTITGSVVLEIDQVSNSSGAKLICDTSELRIQSVQTSAQEGIYAQAGFNLGTADPIRGSPLTIFLPPNTSKVRIHYATSPQASALHWLNPIQTAGKKMPFLYSQSQSIHARSWIPLQDSPAVRVTYSAHIRAAENLMVVMNADNNPRLKQNGAYYFEMTQPIPPYLMAIAVGNFEFKPLGNRSGVYAEPEILDRALWEFSDTEKMLEVAEYLFGPYRWGRYDLLVLPPSFPYGGMENPKLSFISPTTITGDKSQVSVIAHEMAHSWSGNLVTNASWNDFWLNEGITTYLENRLIEAIYGKPRAEMETVIQKESLEKVISTQAARDNLLHLDLKGRDPDEAATDVAYVKGALFLRYLEETFGRSRFDRFLRDYFDHFAFQSVTTEVFVNFLKSDLWIQQAKSDSVSERDFLASIDEWIYRPSFPVNRLHLDAGVFGAVEQQADQWQKGQLPPAEIKAATWSTDEWIFFLRHLSANLTPQDMVELDNVFRLTSIRNTEVATEWLLLSIQKNYAEAFPRLEEFLSTVGRNKYLKPLYSELAKTPKGKQFALSVYKRVRPSYHPITASAIDTILDWNKWPDK
jgi:leukotriene-A4 hydrolase